MIPEESLERLKERFGPLFAAFNTLEVQALVTADSEGYVDNGRLCQITGCHAADITKLLQSLVSRGVLFQENQGRWSRYILPSLPDSLHKDDHSPRNENHYLRKDDHLPRNENHSPRKDDHFPRNESHSLHNEEISSERWQQLMTIAQPAREKKRLSPREMEAVIIELCTNQWLTRRQISDLVQRNADGLQWRILTSMVKHRLLQLRYPETPSRTDQAYKAMPWFAKDAKSEKEDQDLL